ncbi:hypothetical protein [Geoalkalibacter sp.]|uniref:hypothetical protein n=1 Tax=Geoalkalibacter sp. TaxID=3041440 RepID=UPI00272E5300|nr:hypothetical protein [Geoalkalibacter sp.]
MGQDYVVAGLCTNERCETSVFTVRRKRVLVEGQDGQVRQISRLVCPMCRMWGEVVQIEEGAA